MADEGHADLVDDEEVAFGRPLFFKSRVPRYNKHKKAKTLFPFISFPRSKKKAGKNTRSLFTLKTDT